jgi:hypothetical protein
MLLRSIRANNPKIRAANRLQFFFNRYSPKPRLEMQPMPATSALERYNL